MQLYREEQVLLEAAHRKEPSNNAWTQRLSSSLWRQGDMERALGNAAAHETYRRAERLLEAIVAKDPSNLVWRLNLYKVQVRRMSLELRPDESYLATLRTLHAAMEALIREHPTVRDLKHADGHVVELMARAHLVRGDSERSLSLVLPLIDSYRSLRATASDGALDSSAAQALLLKAEIGKARKDATWQDGCREAAAVTAPSAKRSDFAVLAPLAQARLCLGERDGARPLLLRLEKMGYRDQRFIDFIAQYK
jgi:hypothetical protein